ncbi:MAG TPA: hypothetical protein VF166_08085 [Gemmatimonadaceae bacterium]
MPTTTHSSSSIDDLLSGVTSRDDAPLGAASRAQRESLAARRRTPYRLHSAMVVCTECGQAMVDGSCGCARPAWPRIERGQRVQMICAALIAFAFLAKVFAMFLS